MNHALAEALMRYFIVNCFLKKIKIYNSVLHTSEFRETAESCQDHLVFSSFASELQVQLEIQNSKTNTYRCINGGKKITCHKNT